MDLNYQKYQDFNYKNINYTIYYLKTQDNIEYVHFGINNNLIKNIRFEIDKNLKNKLLEVTNNLDNNMAKLISSMKKKEL
jgi:hypothetical protein